MKKAACFLVLLIVMVCLSSVVFADDLYVSPYGDSQRYLALNSTTVLKPEVSGGTPPYSYQWYKDGTLIEGANSISYTTDPVTKYHSYKVEVSDQANHTGNAWFFTHVDNGFKADRLTKSVVYAGTNDQVTLKITGSVDFGEVTYSWYGGSASGKTSDSITVDVVDGAVYTGSVLDNYGNSKSFDFKIHTGDEPVEEIDISRGSGTYYTPSGSASRFSYTATSSVKHTFLINSNIWFEYYYSGDERQAKVYDADTGELLGTFQDQSYQMYLELDLKKGQTFTFYMPPTTSGLISWLFNIQKEAVENNLRVSTPGSTSIKAKPNEPLNLVVTGSCDRGEISYQWYEIDYSSGYQENRIEGANSSTYSIPSVTKSANYYCYVEDEYGNTDSVYYYVSIDNEFSVSADGGETEIYVPYNGSKTLKVNATCNSGEISYQWYEYNTENWSSTLIEGATSSSYTVNAVTKSSEYYCNVSDQYSNNNTIYFSVYVDNNLTAQAVGSNEIYVEPHGSATLKVSASCTNGELTYSWSEQNVYGDTLELTDVTTTSYYDCKVSDIYGNSRYVGFTVVVDNGFTVSRISPSKIYVAPGEELTLSVNASCNEGELDFHWSEYGKSGYKDWSDNNMATLTTVINNGASFYCNVSDQYGNSQSVSFSVIIENELNVTKNNVITISSVQNVTLVADATCKYGELHYQWYEIKGVGERYAISGANQRSCVFEDKDSGGSYICIIEDDYGNSIQSSYTVIWENNFQVVSVGPQYRICNPGEEFSLQVNASCSNNSITYRWTENGLNRSSSDAKVIGTGASVTVSPKYSATYICVVTDSYNNRETVRYNVIVKLSEETIIAGDELTTNISQYDQFATYLFTPQVSGRYCLKAKTRYVRMFLFDSGNMTKQASSSGYGDYTSLEYNFEAGKQYVFAVGYDGGKSNVTVSLESDFVVIPDPELILPSSLTVIESGAFQNVKAKVIKIPSSVTSIAQDAFNSGVTLIVTSGSPAEDWAEKNNVKHYSE